MKGKNNKKKQQLMESISENEPKELEMHVPAMQRSKCVQEESGGWEFMQAESDIQY